MAETNWDILKFKYEILGISLEALSIDNDISLPILNHNAKNWKQLPLAQEDEALTEVERAAKLQTILKQQFLGPKYAELEMILLYKAIEIANNISSDAETTNVLALKNLTEILSNLLAHNPSLIPAKRDESKYPTSGSWEINVITGNGVQENKTINVKDKNALH